MTSTPNLSPDVRLGVARHPATAPATLASIASVANTRVRMAVGGHSATPAETLARLGADPDDAVRVAVANIQNKEAIT